MDIVYTVTTTRCITLKITSVFTAVIKGAYYLRRKVIRKASIMFMIFIMQGLKHINRLSVLLTVTY